MTAQAMDRGSGTSLLERYRKIFPEEFEGTVKPSEAEEWLRTVERVLEAMGVTDAQKVTLATFSLRGKARTWWEALKRQLTAPLPGIEPAVPRVITWERFVRGFNDQYCPISYRLDQEAAFTHLQQGGMTVAEYEDKFAALSEYAKDLVDTEEKRCKRFRMGLSPEMRKELTTYRETGYADLVDMARKSERDSRELEESRQVSKKGRFEDVVHGKFGGGSAAGGERKFHKGGGQSFDKSRGGSSGGWKGKQSRGGDQSERSNTTTASRRCYSCGSMDHMAKDCPDKAKGTKCFKCNEFGHIATHCPKKATPAASSVSSVIGGKGKGKGKGIGESTAPGRVFAVTRQGAQTSPEAVTGIITVSGTYARVLLDPGSTHSFVSHMFIVHLHQTARSLDVALAISTPVGEIVVIELCTADVM